MGLLPTIGFSQSSGTRAQEIEAAREAKAKTIKPDEVSKTENFLRNVKDQKLLERLTAGYNGFRPKIGNMVTGAGFAVGPEYFREDLLGGNLQARAGAQISTRGSYKMEAAARLPQLAKGKLDLELLAVHRNYNSINYYGPGPNSNREGRSAYRLEDTNLDAVFGVNLVRHLKVGASAGLLFPNVGPGTDNRFISSELIYSPQVSPGIDVQTNFRRASVFGQLDFRDDPLGPKSGGNYVVEQSWFEDTDLSRFSFRRLDIDLEQHVPFFNKTRRLVLRAKGAFTYTSGANVVPFYLQPIVGGSDDVRGYRFFRFSDRNSVVYNAEYRWEIFSGLDGAVFFDAGKVMPKPSQLGFSDLETSAGFGFRANARNATWLRVDVGFSHEGFQVWLKFNDLLNPRRFGTARMQPIN
ncbi:MAG: BamA/TamA family outer membrane protein [Bryobacter sp.]|nr:BamA/TamA family outer membrane protein [Bryobacter sp.]